nr:uncharacterized protein LOC109407649 isoform X1 [Aedes albopictus]
MNTSSNNAASAGGEDNLSSGGPHKSNKTNVCLICGIYTNLSVNIFEPRSGPDIREVIYQKYNFKAERNDNEDKYICYSCNNWLINWYSLQCLSESQNYEPSSSRSQSEQRNKRSKNGRSSGGPSKNKENVEQDNHITSTVSIPGNEMYLPKNKSKKPKRYVLNEPVQGNMISHSSKTLVKSFEYNLIKMLECQGTSVTKESMSAFKTSTRHNQLKKSSYTDKIKTTNEEQIQQQSKSKEIILSFNSAISEVVNHVPSLKHLYNNDFERVSPLDEQKMLLCLERLSESLSVSLLNSDSDKL